MTTRFVQRYGGMTTKGGNKPMTFQFSGDDDVWIFIDGILVADLGGIHNQATTTIDFSNGKITINGNEAGTLKEKMSKYYSDEKYPNFWRGDTLSDDTYHTLKLFFLERGGYDSNLAMKFNLAHVPETEGIKVDQFGSRLSGVTFRPLRRQGKRHKQLPQRALYHRRIQGQPKRGRARPARFRHHQQQWPLCPRRR